MRRYAYGGFYLLKRQGVIRCVVIAAILHGNSIDITP